MITQDFTNSKGHFVVVKDSAAMRRHIWVNRNDKPYLHLIENSNGFLNCFNPSCPDLRMCEVCTTFENYKLNEN